MVVGNEANSTTVNLSDDGVTIIGTGAVDFTNCDVLRDALKESCGSAQRVVVDLRDADFIDTAVLEYLARGGNAMRKRGKNLEVLCLENSHPLLVLQVSNIDTLLQIVTEPVPEPEKDTDEQ